MDDYAVPGSAIDWIVKLEIDGIEAGTGFFIGEIGFRRTIFTARHVVCPNGASPNVILVRTAADETFRAVSVATPSTSTDANDFAVLQVLDDIRAPGALLFGAAPKNAFDAIVIGYPANQKKHKSLSVFGLTGAQVVTHNDYGVSNRGVSGGPLVKDGRVVGSAVRTDRSLRLFEAPGLQACIDAAAALQ